LRTQESANSLLVPAFRSGGSPDPPLADECRCYNLRPSSSMRPSRRPFGARAPRS